MELFGKWVKGYSAGVLKGRRSKKKKSMGLHIAALMAKDNFIKEKKEVMGKYIGRRRQQATICHPQQSSVSG